jgi:hypothetical protein
MWARARGQIRAQIDEPLGELAHQVDKRAGFYFEVAPSNLERRSPWA